MADNVYEFLGTKNARLVRFLDKHDNVSALLMKIVLAIEEISRHKNRNIDDEHFEVKFTKDERMLLVKFLG